LLATNQDITQEDSLSFTNPEKLISNVEIETYEDHRMAMSFAPLSILTNITIKDSDVVSKSYPNFWNDLMKIGVKINKS
jgi:3-phosphoshikimate 1-carboxyvinyltransferase